MMTDAQISCIKKSWKIFRGIDPALVADTFYSKLFSDTPGLRRMFPKNMQEQYRKLIDMLSAIVGRLDKFDELNGEIASLARRHVHYGVRPAHYKLVGKALLWTLEQGLGSDWTAETEEAWTKCYSLLAETMIRASEPQQFP